MRITIEQHGKRTQVELPDESNGMEVFAIIVGVLVAVGWSYPVIISALGKFLEDR